MIAARAVAMDLKTSPTHETSVDRQIPQEAAACDLDRWVSMLKKIETAMLVTHDGPTSLHARPMRVVSVQDNGDVWLVTGKHSPKVEEIERTPRVSIISSEDGRYVSMEGRADVREDRAKVEELWSESWRVWFPEGKDDPEIRFIVVTHAGGEFWDLSGGNLLSYVFRAAKAYVSGEKPELNKDAHGVFRKDQAPRGERH